MRNPSSCNTLPRTKHDGFVSEVLSCSEERAVFIVSSSCVKIILREPASYANDGYYVPVSDVAKILSG